MLIRPRLLSTLRGRFDRRLTVVTAGAGFGKSTLLVQAIDENVLDTLGVDAWVRCTPDDAAASVLGTAVCAALGVAAPETADPAAAADVLAEVGREPEADTRMIERRLADLAR
jgi:ATP/maltotriose-dependent transcriptional regulator MalT